MADPIKGFFFYRISHFFFRIRSDKDSHVTFSLNQLEKINK
jgi:hypothetical protein